MHVGTQYGDSFPVHGLFPLDGVWLLLLSEAPGLDPVLKLIWLEAQIRQHQPVWLCGVPSLSGLASWLSWCDELSECQEIRVVHQGSQGMLWSMREDSASHSWSCIVITVQRTSLSPLPTAPQRDHISSISRLKYFMLTVWDRMAFKHVDSFLWFFFTTRLILLNEITILVNSYVHLGQHQALVQLWMSVAPKPASAMALNHQWTDHGHKEGEPNNWGLMLSSQKLKQESTDTPELTNIHCTQTVPSIRTANWLQVLSPLSPFLQKWWGIFISKSAVPIF